MEWQPIETAPKTGYAILLWAPKYQNIWLGIWHNDEWQHFAVGATTIHDDVTHWMLLPPPPPNALNRG